MLLCEGGAVVGDGQRQEVKLDVGVRNALAAAAMGIITFDSSAGGIGGCPYAPGAPGNVATQALVAAFSGRTGVNPERLEGAAAMVRPYLSNRPRPEPGA